MAAKLIKGAEISKQIREEITREVEEGQKTPTIAADELLFSLDNK